MTIRTLTDALDALIPSSLSCDWDNDGLMLCADENAEISGILFALDCDEAAFTAAKKSGCNLIITHHPLIFRPLRRITDSLYTKAIIDGISVMSFHTRLDRLDGGVNDRLALLFGITDTVKFAEDCGRIGTLEYAWDAEKFADMAVTVTGSRAARMVLPGDICHRVAVVSGSGGDFVGEALSLGADTFVSGEIGYHHMLDANAAGLNAIELGHYYSEKHSLSLLRELALQCGFDGKTEILENTVIL